MHEQQRLVVTAAAVNLPVSLQRIRLALKIDDDQTADDALILSIIRTATETAERYTRRSLITRTLTLWRDDWPLVSRSDNYWEGWRQGAETTIISPIRALELPRPPLQSIVHVKTYDDSDNATVYATSNYLADTASEPGRMVLRDGAATPNPTRAAIGLEIQYKAGYGDEEGSIPEGIREGISQLVAYLYEHRGEENSKASALSGASTLWDLYVVQRL